MHHSLVLRHFMCIQTDNSEIQSEKTTFSLSSYEICCDILYMVHHNMSGTSSHIQPGSSGTLERWGSHVAVQNIITLTRSCK
jgi:hypothetical protein